MSIKMRMVSIIIAAAIAFSVLIVGVYALTSYSVPISGNIVFDVVETDVYVNSVTLKNTAKELPNGGYQATDVILTDYSNWYVQSSSDIDISNANVFAGQTLEIDINMKTMSTSEYARPMLTFSNLPSSVTISSNGQYISSTASVYKIYIRNSSQGTINLANINMKMSFTGLSRLLQNDTTNDYYYVEMGTYSTPTSVEYIRWRYFSNGSTAYTYNATTAPSGAGYFILESMPDDALCCWNNDYYNRYHRLHGLTDVLAEHYATSTVRQYLIGNSVQIGAVGNAQIDGEAYPSGEYHDVFSDFNIDQENSVVYDKITPRSLGDLYTEIENYLSVYYTIDMPDTSAATSQYQCTSSTQDKLWLLSSKEANTLLSSTARQWQNSAWWTRSGWTSLNDIHGVKFSIGSSGNESIGNLANTNTFVRPAFVLYGY